MSIDWSSVRAEFPALANWTFLNTATFGQLPRRATDAVAAHFAHRDATACHDFLDWFDDMDRLRASIAQLIHASADDIAFMPTAAHGLSVVLSGIDWKRGDRVLTLEGEFPNNTYGLSHMARLGVSFVEVPWERFDEELHRGARLVALSTANYMTGFRPPVERISRELHERGGLLFVDGTQSVGAIEFDCTKVQPDFLAVHGYKWLLCPNGAGFLYVSPQAREWLGPNVIGWRSDHRWRSVNELHHGEPEFKDTAEKYEGSMITFPCLYAMQASVGMMLELGPADIESRVFELAARCRAVLERAGGKVLHPDTPILAARFPGRDAAAIAAHLRDRRILTSARHGNLRVSTHFYNNEEDLNALEDALR
jgi:selenocysteine lyase/cysteine desulfurase